MSARRLFVFSPLPPAPNGLADYLLTWLPWLGRDFDLTLVAEQGEAAAARAALPSSRVIDETAFLAQPPGPHDQVLYNLGNNPGCTYMLGHTAHHPGALLLHDPALLYLHQLADARHWTERLMGGRLAAEGHRVPDAFVTRDGRLRWTPGLLYQECLLLADLLRPMHGVLVHSRYAAQRLAGLVQARLLTHVPHVIQAPPLPEAAQAAAVLAPLGIADDDVLLLVPGFLSGNKMLYEVLVAHHALAATHPRLKLVFAGEARPHEYDLAARIAALWPQGGGPQITGYLDAAALDVLLARADICCVLRHPTYGESSGLLPRAATSGAAVVTVDSGAYAELDLPSIQRIRAGPGATAALTATLAALLAAPQERAARRAAALLRARALAPAALYPRLRGWLDACHAAATTASATA